MRHHFTKCRTIGNLKSKISNDQHRVPVAIKAILHLDRFLICALDEVKTREGGHEYERRRSRQVKVGDQCVDHPERIARPYEKACNSLVRLQLSLPFSDPFQGSGASGADRNHTMTALFGSVDP